MSEAPLLKGLLERARAKGLGNFPKRLGSREGGRKTFCLYISFREEEEEAREREDLGFGFRNLLSKDDFGGGNDMCVCSGQCEGGRILHFMLMYPLARSRQQQKHFWFLWAKRRVGLRIRNVTCGREKRTCTTCDRTPKLNSISPIDGGPICFWHHKEGFESFPFSFWLDVLSLWACSLVVLSVRAVKSSSGGSICSIRAPACVKQWLFCVRISLRLHICTNGSEEMPQTNACAV